MIKIGFPYMFLLFIGFVLYHNYILRVVFFQSKLTKNGFLLSIRNPIIITRIFIMRRMNEEELHECCDIIETTLAAYENEK